MPFVQGYLRREPLAVTIRSECAHCRRALAVRIDHALRYEITTREAAPLVFLPLVNFARLKAESIIDDF